MGLVSAVVLSGTARGAAETPRSPRAVHMADNVRETPRRLSDYDLPGLSNTVNLKSVEPWDVVQLIEFLAYRGGLNNIVIGNGVAGLATKLKFEDVTVGEALEVVLSVNNLAFETRGGIITIMTDAEYEAIHGVSFYDQKQVRIVELRYADATRVAGMLGSIKSDIGTVVADPLTGTLILIDTPAKIAEMRAVIESTDLSTVSRVIPTETRSYVLSHADVDPIALAVEKLLTRDVGSVYADARTRTLMVSDLPHNLNRVDEMVRLFDQRPKQVFIEAKILELTLTDDYQLGVNWNAFFDAADPRSQIAGVVRSPILGTDNPGIGTLNYKTIIGGSSALEGMIDALKTVGDVKVLSNPHVAVIDGQEASVKVIQDTPYAETSAEITGTDTNFVGESIVFIEVGVLLTVTPRIGEDGYINMAIRPEVSSASYDYQAFRQIPVVKRTYSETQVLIKDQETIIIAGMISNSSADVERRVPIFGKIPLIGILFRSTQKRLETRELVVFLTPRIITGDQPVLRLRDLQKRPKPLRATAGVETETKPFKPLR